MFTGGGEAGGLREAQVLIWNTSVGWFTLEARPSFFKERLLLVIYRWTDHVHDIYHIYYTQLVPFSHLWRISAGFCFSCLTTVCDLAPSSAQKKALHKISIFFFQLQTDCAVN